MGGDRCPFGAQHAVFLGQPDFGAGDRSDEMFQMNLFEWMWSDVTADILLIFFYML